MYFPHTTELCLQNNLYQIILLILVGEGKKKTKIFPLFKCISCLPYCYRLCCGRPIYSLKKGKSTTGGRKTKLGKNRRKCGCHLAKQSRTNWAQKSPSLSEAAGSEQSTILLLSPGPHQGCWVLESHTGHCRAANNLHISTWEELFKKGSVLKVRYLSNSGKCLLLAFLLAAFSMAFQMWPDW